MRTSLKNLFASPAFIAGIAFLFRVALLYLDRGQLLGTPGEPYGFEAGQVARSIALGRGFSSPLLLANTGPTAYLCPIYPFVLAGIFKVWGIYSLRSHVIALTLNSGLAALTILPIYAIANRSFGHGTAVLASWLWVILPDAWHIPIGYVWDSTLSAFWLALVFWATLVVRERSRIVSWAAYGALWSIGGMINATILSLLPFFLVWLVWDLRKKSSLWIRLLGIMLLVFVAGLTPWTVRNYRVFHTFIPMRSNLGLMLWVGNNPVAVGVDSFALTAVWDRSEAEHYQRVGEVRYMQQLQARALAFMRSHPGKTSRNVGGRMASFWFAVTDRPNNTWRDDPLYVRVLLAANALLVALCMIGAVAAWRPPHASAYLYLVVLLVYPLTYYVTCSLVRYRFCIESLVVILAAYGGEKIAGKWISRVSASETKYFATLNAARTHKSTTANKAAASATAGTGIRPPFGLATWSAIP
jgi:hypothetical protein